MKKLHGILSLALFAIVTAGCAGSASAPQPRQSGGATGSGGSSQGAGGSQGKGGGSGSGGSATGGSSATGGVTATGGGSGGTSALGGATSSGGRTGSGGTSVSGGQTSGGAGGGGGSTTGGSDAGAGRDGSTASGGRATGGTTGTGGTLATGGTTGTGGTTSTGGTTGKLTPQDAVKLMSPGWNLGNSFDATPNETSWGNPTPSQTLIKAVHAAGFKLLRLPVGWTDHIGAGPSYTIDSAWMNKVKKTAQWAVDEGMYVFLNTHHDSDGGNGGWVSFPSTTSAAQTVATEVTAVWTQIANAFKSFDSKLMFECFNEPNYTAGRSTQAEIDLNLYLEACFKAIRDTGGANSTRIVMIQPIGASPIQAGIQNIQKVSFINDPNLVISLHTYYPTNFGLSTTPYAWGSATDYTNMKNSLAQEIRVWLPTQVIFIGEWGSMNAQPAANRAAHAQAYAQDTTTANVVPIWWDNGGSGSESFSLFDRNSGAVTQSAIVNGLMTGVKNGLASPNNWATGP
jgi:endoglucanase